jgi:predicted membrane protein
MKKREVFWGLLFIFAAVLIILNQMGYFTAGVSYLDIVATVVLVGIMITSLLHINFWGILFPLAGLCIIYAEEWHITEFTPWPALLTAFLCSIGLSMIFHRPQGWHYHTCCDSSFGSNVVNVKDDNVINCSTSFGECIKYVNSDNFEKANIKCSFGDVKVYFDNAQIPSGKADIYLDVSFGDAELFIPKTWKVVNDLHVFLGDAGEKNRNLDATSPVVTIHGNVSFGDAEIFYV